MAAASPYFWVASLEGPSDVEMIARTGRATVSSGARPLANARHVDMNKVRNRIIADSAGADVEGRLVQIAQRHALDAHVDRLAEHVLAPLRDARAAGVKQGVGGGR